MATRNHDVGCRKCSDRKVLRRTVLSAKKLTQQYRMKTGKKDATGKKGDERKAFMSDCLKG